MERESLIRRSVGAAFFALLGAGLGLSGSAALAGLPLVFAGLLPDIAAQASPEGRRPQGIARLLLAADFGESPYAPQVLYPVAANPFPAWLTEAVRAARSGPPPGLRGLPALQRPVIAICIDDLGEDIAGTDLAIKLPRAVALSFLPFPDTTPFLAAEAARQGHLILAHVPMQAIGPQNPGPMTLMSGMASAEITRRLDWDLARLPGIAGINNHEGSRFTADAGGLAPVMAGLKARHLFFFDSRTGPDSKVAAAANAVGVMSAARDIFLDDDQSASSVSAQLDALAAAAKRSGVAIAIGHPHAVTLKLLAAWLARDHSVTLVPLDEAIRIKGGRETAVALR